MSHHDEAKLDVKFIDFARQMNLYLNHFPKHEKYGLCQQIRNSAYALYGFIVESQKRYQKKTSLTNADITHEQLRMYIRLAFELGYFKFKNGALCHLLTTLKANHHDLFDRIPPRCYANLHPYPTPA